MTLPWSIQESPHLLPDDTWQALLKISDHINALHIDPVEQRVLQDSVEILALKTGRGVQAASYWVSNRRLTPATDFNRSS